MSAPGRTIVVTEAALRELAADWFRRGFACSGERANGETPGLAVRGGPFASLLRAEFERQWGARRLAGEDGASSADSLLRRVPRRPGKGALPEPKP